MASCKEKTGQIRFIKIQNLDLIRGTYTRQICPKKLLRVPEKIPKRSVYYFGDKRWFKTSELYLYNQAYDLMYTRMWVKKFLHPRLYTDRTWFRKNHFYY